MARVDLLLESRAASPRGSFPLALCSRSLEPCKKPTRVPRVVSPPFVAPVEPAMKLKVRPSKRDAPLHSDSPDPHAASTRKTRPGARAATWSAKIPIASAGQDAHRRHARAPARPPRPSSRPSLSHGSSRSVGSSCDESERLALTMESFDFLAQSLPRPLEYDDALDSQYRRHYSMRPYEIPNHSPDLAQLQDSPPRLRVSVSMDRMLNAWHTPCEGDPPIRIPARMSSKASISDSIAERLDESKKCKRFSQRPSFAASRATRRRPASLAKIPIAATDDSPLTLSAASLITPRATEATVSNRNMYPGLSDSQLTYESHTSPFDPYYRIPTQPDSATVHMNVTHAEARVLLHARKSQLLTSKPSATFSLDTADISEEEDHWNEEYHTMPGPAPLHQHGLRAKTPSKSRWSATESAISHDGGLEAALAPQSPRHEQAVLEMMFGERFEQGAVL